MKRRKKLFSTSKRKQSTAKGYASLGLLLFIVVVAFISFIGSLLPSSDDQKREEALEHSPSVSVSQEMEPSSTPLPSSQPEISVSPSPSESADPVEDESTEPVETPAATPVESNTPEPDPVPSSPSTQQPTMVWISSHGNRYHRKASCSGMEDPWQVTLEEAQAMGRTPCGRCYG